MTPDEQTGELAAIREEARVTARRGAYFWLVMIVTVLMAFAASTLITVKLNERYGRKLCAVVISADDQYHESPPTTAAGRSQAANFSRLRQDLGCPPFKESEQ